MKMRHLNTKMVIFLAIVIVIFASFLRLYKLDSIPSSLYWEEAALGYDASLLRKPAKIIMETLFHLLHLLLLVTTNRVDTFMR